MPRVTKAPEERRLEIIQTAERLFQEIGYAKCSVERIIKEIGVAKGTFYYYFKSKPAILEAIVERRLGQIVEAAERVAAAPDLGALDKMQMLLSGGQVSEVETEDLTELLHMPENRELHELSNVQSIERLSPILARIVEQGNAEGVFDAPRPLETIQFLFCGAQFLLDGGLFQFSEAEQQARRDVSREIIEKALGAAPGSFGFMVPSGRGPKAGQGP